MSIVVLHATDLVFLGVKLGEIILLLSMPLMLSTLKRVHKYQLYFLFLIVIFSLQTVFVNLGQRFYLFPGISILKQPYFITLSRAIELLLCVLFSISIYKLSSKYIRENRFDQFVSWFTNLNVGVSVLFLVGFGLEMAGVLETGLVHEPNRLKGLYVEGGPLGLFYATLFVFTRLQRDKFKFAQCVFFVVLLLSRSKAGIMLVVCFYLFRLSVRRKLITKLILVFFSTLALSFFAAQIAQGYINDIQNIQKMVKERGKDTNLVMGRISGLFISKNIIQDRPWLGVGLGNYSLVRNNPKYLDFLPPIKLWDLSGLGGWVTLLIENGIIGLFLFASIVILLYRDRRLDRNYLVLFILPMMLGVQLYFPYPWFYLGLAIARQNENES